VSLIPGSVTRHRKLLAVSIALTLFGVADVVVAVVAVSSGRDSVASIALVLVPVSFAVNLGYAFWVRNYIRETKPARTSGDERVQRAEQVRQDGYVRMAPYLATVFKVVLVLCVLVVVAVVVVVAVKGI
jgi:hypothetical protein